MTEPFLGEIRAFSFSFPPKGWAFCDGAPMNIAQNQALYSLIGIQFGGDAKTTFNLPDFQGRVALGAGRNANSGISYVQGVKGGATTVTLTTAMIPAHIHGAAVATIVADNLDPTGNIMATTSQGDNGSGGTVPAPNIYGPTTPAIALNAGVVGTTGTGAAHPNVQPYTTVNFCIALTGDYPPRP